MLTEALKAIPCVDAEALPDHGAFRRRLLWHASTSADLVRAPRCTYRCSSELLRSHSLRAARSNGARRCIGGQRRSASTSTCSSISSATRTKANMAVHPLSAILSSLALSASSIVLVQRIAFVASTQRRREASFCLRTKLAISASAALAMKLRRAVTAVTLLRHATPSCATDLEASTDAIRSQWPAIPRHNGAGFDGATVRRSSE